MALKQNDLIQCFYSIQIRPFLSKFQKEAPFSDLVQNEARPAVQLRVGGHLASRHHRFSLGGLESGSETSGSWSGQGQGVRGRVQRPPRKHGGQGWLGVNQVKVRDLTVLGRTSKSKDCN